MSSELIKVKKILEEKSTQLLAEKITTEILNETIASFSDFELTEIEYSFLNNKYKRLN